MPLFLIIAIIVALYFRTIDYYYLIDDIVRRWGFLLVIPETSPPPQFFAIKPSRWRHLFLTLTHAVNCSLIYFIWGWKAALLFAVNPLCVSCTAWITGGYYQITAYFTLVSYFFLMFYHGAGGMLLSTIFFTAALGSTINCIGWPFLFLFLAPHTGLVLFWPLACYLGGHRFRIGFRKRNAGKGDPLTWGKVYVVPKVLAFYIKRVVFPKNLAFFQEFGCDYGKNEAVKKEFESPNLHFYQSLAIIASFCIFGFLLSPLGTLIFLFLLLPFTQWKVLGQFVAERYLYLPLIGYSLILASLFSKPYVEYLIWPLAAAYAWRAHKYIPAFKNIETLYQNGIEQFPRCISNYVNLAERKLHIGKFYDAYKLLHQGLKIEPDSFLCHANLAAYWLSIRRPREARVHTEKAIKYSESRGMAYNVFRQQLAHIDAGLVAEGKHVAEVEKLVAEMKPKEKDDVSTESGLTRPFKTVEEMNVGRPD